MVRALMLDVDGVIVDGRPEDGRHWHTTLEEDFGFARNALDQHFFTPHWQDIVLGHAGLMDRLPAALQKIAPHLSADAFVSYWFKKDSRVITAFLPELARLRSSGVRVYLATNQEHLRAAYLMDDMGLAEHVDGIFYSAALGAMKPDMKFFSKVQDAVGLRGEELLLIDDRLENITAALKAGWRAHHWTTDSSPTMVRGLCA